MKSGLFECEGGAKPFHAISRVTRVCGEDEFQPLPPLQNTCSLATATGSSVHVPAWCAGCTIHQRPSNVKWLTGHVATMPLGFERLNERTQRPNANINFIKPLAGPDKAHAQDFLERIAAQCYPVMKANYISVMALEEYEPNPEFLGRNFNAGEVIQLVLKDRSGRWMSFRSVQMVMMHELAHCKQMNHSKFFWQVRNGYAKEMEELWKRRYTGEGLWGRGQMLLDGQYADGRMPEGDAMPEHLCGGTYRSARGRKRKRGAGADNLNMSYAERQQRRIAKKFGMNGQSLGADELLRTGIEKGTNLKGKPRVAKSKRGRELRAQAALARFEQAKQSTPEQTPDLEDDEGSDIEWSESEYDDGESEMAVGIDGVRIKDSGGHGMVRICGDEDEKDEDAKREMDELNDLDDSGVDEKIDTGRKGAARSTSSATGKLRPQNQTFYEDSETESEAEEGSIVAALTNDERQSASEPEEVDSHVAQLVVPPADIPSGASAYKSLDPAPARPSSTTLSCPICSLENDPDAPTCVACSNVLKPSLMANHWRCRSETCKGSRYINAGDAGRCGLCGGVKPTTNLGSEKAVGFGTTSADVLRWD